MKTLIITNKERFPEQDKRSSQFLKSLKNMGIEGEIYNIHRDKPLHIQFLEIQKRNAPLIVSFDFAGFEFRTEQEEISLNLLYGRIAYILLNHWKIYENPLKERMNFSMFIYCQGEEEAKRVRQEFPDVPNVGFYEGKGEEIQWNPLIEKILLDTELEMV